MKKLFRRASLLLVLMLGASLIGIAQQSPAEEASHSAQAPATHQVEGRVEPGTGAHSETAESSGGPNEGVGVILGGASERAAHTAEGWGKIFGLGKDTSYLISLVLNFAGIAVLFYFLLRSKLPQALRDRTASIQKAIKEAEAASAEATARLSGIEARLAKLDTDIADIRTESEKQAVAEEARIRAAAEEDKNKVVESAKAEIDSIARNARRDLKTYAASLAIDIAAKRIRVDDRTDQALVRRFVDQLGKDGR